MSEQARFQEWWELTGTNSVILRAQAWSAWLARAEAEQPQSAEDPDEWVIQDRVPVRPGIDQVCWNEKLFDAQAPFGFIETCCGSQSDGKMHGYGADGCYLSARCRRRYLPKVEQPKVEQAEQCAACDAPAEPGTAGCKDCNEYATAICSPEPEQWPKYYHASFKANQIAFVRRDSFHQYTPVMHDGTELKQQPWFGDDNCRIELTEAEAMALIQKPQPQPQKTRVRLFASEFGDITAAEDHPGDEYQEIHHDSEGFYVEGGQS